MADIDGALTTAGQALTAKINAGNGTIPLNITRIVTGSGTSPDPLNLAAVVDERQTFTITEKTTAGLHALISVMLTNTGNPSESIPPLAQGYSLTQIGFYADDPDEGEILYRISQFENPNYVPAANERGWTLERTFSIYTANASVVNVTVDPLWQSIRNEIEGNVKYNAAQALNSTQQAQARANIGAVAASEINTYVFQVNGA